MSTTRPLRTVPRWVVVLLLTGLAIQVHWQAFAGRSRIELADLPPAPSARLLRAATLDEPELAARGAMLYLQAFDLRRDNPLPYAQLDYHRLRGWLKAIQETDPRSSYALFSAARIYAEVSDPDKCRTMLEFVHEAFLAGPQRRWPWLAHAAMVAKHRLKDLPQALAYAQAIEEHTQNADAPAWARQMQAFILEDLNELEAAKILLGGLVANGHLRDLNEQRFLQARLDALEHKLAAR